MHIPPDEVIFPKTRWRLVEVLADQGAERAAYALGYWQGNPAIGFRWNGGSRTGRLGFPQQRGLPTWTILDPMLHAAVVAALPSAKQPAARRFLKLKCPAEWTQAISGLRRYHSARLSAIAAGDTPTAILGGASIVLHVIPIAQADKRLPQLLETADRFPPPASLHPAWSRLECGSLVNGDCEASVQRSYVSLSPGGVLEAVASGLGETEHAIHLGKIGELVVTYSRHYAAGLYSAGLPPPFAVMAGFVGVEGFTAITDHRAVLRSTPDVFETESVELPEGVFDSVPSARSETATCLQSLLTALSQLPQHGAIV